MINAAAKYYFIENWYLAADVIPSKFLARLFYLPLFGHYSTIIFVEYFNCLKLKIFQTFERF